MGREPEVAEPQKTINEKLFKIKGEPLYGRKGKISSDLTSKNGDNDRDVACSEERYINQTDKEGNKQGPSESDSELGKREGLQQPRLQGTQGIVRGEDKTIMRKENKRQRLELRTKQPVTTPWTQHEGKIPSIPPTDHTTRPPH